MAKLCVEARNLNRRLGSLLCGHVRLDGTAIFNLRIRRSDADRADKGREPVTHLTHPAQMWTARASYTRINFGLGGAGSTDLFPFPD